MTPVPTKNPIWPLVLGIILFTTACARSAVSPDSGIGPVGFQGPNGTWVVSAWQGPLGDLDPSQDFGLGPVVVDLSTETMTLEGTAGCGVFYGSFSFGRPGDDAYASFTIPGRADSPCEPPPLATQDAAIAALEAIDSFVLSGERIELSGPGVSATLEPAS